MNAARSGPSGIIGTDALGSDALDIGALAEGWRSEPGTPISCDPSMPAWPTTPLPADELVARLLAAPAVPLSRARATASLGQAERGPAGGIFPTTA